jgi:endonuclease/exonuclease/phosphatase family metal-dependent hydrolase
MRLMGWRKIAQKGSLVADIELPQLGRTQVFCVRLTLSYPARILQEFQIVMQQRDPALPTIICGDLNIVERLHIMILNWLLGGKLSDIFAWRTLREAMEEKFARLNLQNPLRGKPTQTISRSQLDHILVPNDMRILSAEVLPERCGSDHHPVFVETADSAARL